KFGHVVSERLALLVTHLVPGQREFRRPSDEDDQLNSGPFTSAQWLLVGTEDRTEADVSKLDAVVTPAPCLGEKRFEVKGLTEVHDIQCRIQVEMLHAVLNGCEVGCCV